MLTPLKMDMDIKTCCCGIKAQTALPVVTFVGCVLDIVLAIICLVNLDKNCALSAMICATYDNCDTFASYHQFCTAIGIAIGLLILFCAFSYFAVFFAHREQKVSLFRPFLIFKAIHLTIFALSYLMTVLLVTSGKFEYDIVALVPNLAIVGLHMCFYCIIFGVYKDLKAMNQFNQPPLAV